MKDEKPKAIQLGLFNMPIDAEEEPAHENTKQSVLIPLELDASRRIQREVIGPPELPARWEAARLAAEKKNVLPLLLRQIRPVPALDYVEYLVSIVKDEGCAWVVYGESGSGKSSFFHTLEYQTSNQIRTHIIDGNDPRINLANQLAVAGYLKDTILQHKEKNGEDVPLIIILEERETSMTVDERSSIAQALRNTLRPPGPGKNVIFVLPVTNPSQGDLFIRQVRDTGVFIPIGQDAIYTFRGPSYDEHVNILTSLFVALNDRDIDEFGLQRSDLQKLVSSQQTIGQYIRNIREELIRRNRKYQQIVRNNSYRPFTVITCFINPLPAYRTEPTIKGMTLNAFGKIRTAEILRATKGQMAQQWQEKRQALQNIMEALDVRIVEVPPAIITKLLYAYGWQKKLSTVVGEETTSMIERYLTDEGIKYNAPKSVRQNLRQQLKASNLFRIIAGEETVSHPTPKFSNRQDELSSQELTRRNDEEAEIALTRLACTLSHDHQHDFHDMFAQALKDLLGSSATTSAVADFKDVYPEATLMLNNAQGIFEKKIRPDIVIEMQDNLFLLELCWRSEDHFTYADIAAYILRKIRHSYMYLPLVSALAEGSLPDPDN